MSQSEGPSAPSATLTRRVLIIDDDEMIHRVLRKMLNGRGIRERARPRAVGDGADGRLGETAQEPRFQVESAYHGPEGLRCVRQALAEGRPYALAFVDMRMPAGWDGLDTIARIWEVDPRVQIVICTGHSDYTLDEITERLGHTDKLLFLSKPFDNTEARQLASALTEKWLVAREAERARSDLERLVAERTQELRDSAERLGRESARTERLLGAISSIMIGVDADDRIIQWNAAAEGTFGIARHDVMGRTFLTCGIRWDWSALTSRVPHVLASDRPAKIPEVRFKRTDGSEGFLDITISPIRGETNRRSEFLVLGEDVTERRMLQSQLLQAQKLESIGQLAAGIAHEINTPTQYVSDNTYFLQDAFADLAKVFAQYATLRDACARDGVHVDALGGVREAEKEADLEYLKGEIPQAISQSLEGLRRVTTIVQAMKGFAHPDAPEMSQVDINKAIENTVTVARNEWKYVADVRLELEPGLPAVVCSAGEVNQVILNILVNAAHAIGEVTKKGSGKGTITISTRSDRDSVEIRIADTGPGIPDEVKPRIFDPFFTTKEVGKGTGQGLAISRSVVVDKHHGSLDLETEVGTGTTFVVRLPKEPPSEAEGR